MTKRWMYAYVPVLLFTFWHAASDVASACPPAMVAPTSADFQAAIRNARDRGALWRFEKDDRHGYLYGTIHVGKLDWAIPGRTVDRALRDAAVIALEIDPLDPQVLQELSAPQAASDRPELSQEMWSRLRIQAAKACIPWEQLHALAPIDIALRLAIVDGRWDGLEPDYGKEFVLAGFARATGKAVVMLESPAEQRRIFRDRPSAEQLMMIEATLSDLEAGKNREALNSIANAWARGDLAQLARHGERCSAELQPFSVMKICERNLTIAERIDTLHQRGQRVFVAVGILHMIHERALPKLLEERGFRVERVAFEPL